MDHLTEHFPRQLQLSNDDTQSLSSGNANTVKEPSSAFLIPFILTSQHSTDATKLLETLRGERRHVRAAWFFVAVFSTVRGELVRWGRHPNYRTLAGAWREYFWSRREKIYESIRLKFIELVEADPWRGERDRTHSQKEAQTAAEALVLQLCKITGERPSSRGKIQVVLFFNDANALGSDEYSLVTVSHLFLHLPIMFLHITPRQDELMDESEECATDLGRYFLSEALVPLPMDMPLEIRSSYLWEFLSGRMLWRAIYYGPVEDNVPPYLPTPLLVRRNPIPEDIDVDMDLSLPNPKLTQQTQNPSRSMSFPRHNATFGDTPIRLLDLLNLLLGEDHMSRLTKTTATELPMFGFVFRNAWVHFTRVIHSDYRCAVPLGTQLENALSQRAGLVDSQMRVFIPVFSASSAQAGLRHEIATSAVMISFGDSSPVEGLDLTSLPDLLPLLVVQFMESSPLYSPKVEVNTMRTSASGAFGYQITASGVQWPDRLFLHNTHSS